MSTSGTARTEAGQSEEPTTEDLDRTFIGTISTNAVIAFGGVDDTFFYYPRSGFIPGESLDDKLGFDIDKEKLTKLERLGDINFHYEEEGDVYQLKVFARVTEGN